MAKEQRRLARTKDRTLDDKDAILHNFRWVCIWLEKLRWKTHKKKTWKIASTHERIKGFLNKQCICQEEHAQVRGKDAKASEGYTDEIVDVAAQCLLEDAIYLKPVRKAMTREELERHQRQGHDPFDSRCKDC